MMKYLYGCFLISFFPFFCEAQDSPSRMVYLPENNSVRAGVVKVPPDNMPVTGLNSPDFNMPIWNPGNFYYYGMPVLAAGIPDSLKNDLPAIPPGKLWKNYRINLQPCRGDSLNRNDKKH